MRTTGYRGVLLAAALAVGSALQAAGAENPEPEAISASVSGNVQKVGFRAMILRQAIEYNLAGAAKNNPDGTVQFSLQGDENRIDQAVKTIRKGTKKSANVKVSITPTTVDPNLNKFTVFAWTSTSRHITNPYDLIFTLRSNDKTISKKEAKEFYHEILRTTLKGEDLNKLGDDDED